jgi:hypothetical protein
MARLRCAAEEVRPPPQTDEALLRFLRREGLGGAGVADLETLDTVGRRHARARAPAAGRRVEGRQ